MTSTAIFSKDVVKTLVLVQGAFTVVFSRAMAYLLKMISPLQMIFHLPALNFAFPSNSMSMFSNMVPIINYDLLEGVPAYQDFLELISGMKE